MKINVNAELNGNELIEFFLKQSKENNLSIEPNQVKIFVKSKDNKEVEISPDRLRLAYSNV